MYFSFFVLADWLKRNGADSVDTLSNAQAGHEAGIKSFGDFEGLDIDEVPEVMLLGTHELALKREHYYCLRKKKM